jgi:hypothetical protein
MAKTRNAYRLLEIKTEVKRQLGRPRRKSVDNIKIGFRDFGWGAMDLIALVQVRNQGRALVNMIPNFRVP